MSRLLTENTSDEVKMMKKGYRLLGEFIRQVDVRNTEGKEENLLGVSVQKQFIPSIANTVGTDFTKYKVVRKGQFTYIPDTSRRGDKIGIALLEDYDEGLVSNVYTVFEVIDENQLMPEYLMLWFSRPEFDRYARFKSHGSVREVMDWDEMCKVELPVPSIEKQRSIVKSYKAITDRIALKKRINDNLAEYLNCIFIELAKSIQETTSLSAICGYVTDKLAFSDIETAVYISTENILPDKQGVSSFGSTSASERVVHFREEDVLVSNIRPYFKKMWFATTEGGCNADVLCFRASDKKYSYLLKSILFQDGFFDYVMSGAKGTKMPRGDKNHIMQYQIPCFSDQQLQKFNALASSVEQNQALNRQEMASLETAKHMLLTILSR
ncbi:Restriction endonuclease S subunits [[Eubacterium] siraeum 70/3]|uniref:Restriction endonuclease S subunits n=1 Tax=[Eubacterium] siraeum 70/3 TaxID=657319 RepID=D4JQV2_9FIRM|nr:Restriction endonuclease S subunits [[Eubacterium] siraeum 70/3]